MMALKKTVRLLVSILLLTAVTSTAQAENETCALHALDSIAGLGTEVTLISCEKFASNTLTVIAPSGTKYTQTIALDGAGKATTIIPSKATTSAGTYSVHFLETSSSFTILPDRPDDTKSSISASPVTVTSTNTNVTVTAIVRDRYDNPVSGQSIALLSSRPNDEITAVSSSSDDEGRFVWKITPAQTGTMTLIPYDVLRNRQLKMSAVVEVGTTRNIFSPWKSSLIGTEQGGENDDMIATQVVNNTASNANQLHFEMSLPQNAQQVKANELFSVDIRAMRGSEVVRSYIGTLIVESSDSDAELPKKGEDPNSPRTGRIDMRNVDQGERKVPLSFSLRKQGKQTITVTDKTDKTLSGSIEITVVGNSGTDGETVRILDPVDGSHIRGGSSIILQGKAPSFINLKVKGGKEMVMGESDAEGVFRINVPLQPEYKEVTLFVTSENGAYESNPVHLIIDTDGPALTSGTITPIEGKVGSPAQIIVNAERGLPSVSATVGGKETILTASGSTYSGTIIAPDIPGLTTISVLAKDQVGNTSTLILQWNVTPKTLPKVMNVKAESQMGKVALSWNPVTLLPIREYRIYIAEKNDPTNILFSLNTGTNTASVVIGNLPIGKTYLFSVTSVGIDGNESTEKSDPATGGPLGINLKATPGKDSVRLEWNGLSGITLERYTLEFGTEPSVYTEKRTIDGKALTTNIRDLLGGVTYEFRLTPIAVTGKILKEYSTVLRVKIEEGSFIAGASDPASPSALPPVDLHKGAPVAPKQWEDIPRTSDSGLSSMILFAIAFLALGAGWYIFERKKEEKMMRELVQFLRKE